MIWRQFGAPSRTSSTGCQKKIPKGMSNVNKRFTVIDPFFIVVQKDLDDFKKNFTPFSPYLICLFWMDHWKNISRCQNSIYFQITWIKIILWIQCSFLINQFLLLCLEIPLESIQFVFSCLCVQNCLKVNPFTMEVRDPFVFHQIFDDFWVFLAVF